MKKTIGKRLVCGLTSTVMAATLSLGNMSSFGVLNAAAAVFNYAPETNIRSANEQCAKIRFVDKYNNATNMTLPDNTYYLLVHAVGAEPDDGDDSTFYYSAANGTDTDHYELIPINADGMSWTSDKFDLIEPRTVKNSAGDNVELVADTVSVDGVILKAKTPGAGLSEADAIARNNCAEVDEMEGWDVTYSEMSAHTYAQYAWENDTHVFDVKYTGETAQVNIEVYEYDGATLAPLENGVDCNYYLLTTLKEGSTDVAWNLSKIDLEGSRQLKFGVPYFTKFGSNDKVEYDPDKYTFVTRVYRTADSSTELSGPEDCGVPGKSSDTIPNYTFISNEYDVNTKTDNIKLQKGDISYKVDIVFDGGMTITESDNIYLLVKDAHTNSEDSYYLKKIVTDGQNTLEVKVDKWQDRNGQTLEHETYNGERYYVKLIKTGEGFNMTSIDDPTKYSEVDILKGQEASYTSKQSVFENAATNAVVYSDTITFAKVPVDTGLTYNTVLGDGVYYGITANKFEQSNHTETNFAVNYYEGNEKPSTPDISGYFGGHIYIEDFVNFTNEINNYPTVDTYSSFNSSFTIDANGKINLDAEENCCRDGVVLHVDKEGRLLHPRDKFAKIYEEDGAIKTGVVDPIIANMQSVSAELVNHEQNVEPVILGDKAYISGEGYPEGATLYVDADAIVPYFMAGKLDITLDKDQVIVFNFKNTKNVEIGEFNFTKIGGDSNKSDTPSGENTLLKQKNYWLDQNVARNVVFNLNSVEGLAINIASGMFLVPNEKSVTRITGTSSGWLQSAGYVNNPDGEWHFLYTDLPRNTTVISVDKKNITGKEEVEGAHIVIRNSDNKVVAEWDSNGKPHSVRLAPGEYVLEETGEPFVFEEQTYNIIPSKVSFTVTADADPESYDCTIDNVQGVEEEPDYNSDTGYYLYDETSKAFTLCDALSDDDTTDVTVSKKTVANEAELPGAKLKITSATTQTVDWDSVLAKTQAANRGVEITAVVSGGKTVGIQWISGEEAVKVAGLQNNTYILEETGADEDGFVKIGNDYYKVVPSTLRFTVNSGAVTSATGQKRAADKTSETGYYLADTAKRVFTVCDAMRVDAELQKLNDYNASAIDGAKLSLTGKDSSGKAIMFTSDNVQGGTLSSDKTTITWTSDKTDNLKLYDLKNGVYTMHEEEPPKGFKSADDVKFVVSGGKISLGGTTGSLTNGKIVSMRDKPLANVIINKYDLTGLVEVEGAKLTLRKVDANGNETVVDTVDGAGEPVSNPWISAKESSFSVALEDGTYTLTEEASDASGEIVTENGKYYTIIKSKLTFTVKNGEIDRNNASAGSANICYTPDPTATEEYYDVEYTKIGVCDAEIKSAPVYINKFDITGENEVAGAQLTITSNDENVDWARIAQINPDSETIGTGANVSGLKWTSTGNNGWSVSLRDGTYVLTETAVDAAAAGDEYTIIPSSVEFTVENGKVKTGSVKSSKTTISTAAQQTATDEDTESYVIHRDGEFFICDAKKVTPIVKTDVTISKSDVTGEKELTGAQLEVRSTTDADWDEIFEANKDKVEKIVENSKTVGVKWTSDASAPVVLKDLTNGTYTLKETGKPFTIGGITYDVIESTVTFVVTDGKVTSVTSDKNDVKTNADSTSETGYVLNKTTDNENKIVICDAEAVKTNVTISKSDITGQPEIDKAKLEITSTTVDWTGVTITNVTATAIKSGDKITGYNWESSDKAASIANLRNGTYTLKETGDAFVASDGNTYEVVTSTVTFTIADGKVTSVVSNNDDVKTAADAESETGYVLADKDNNTITICDAKRVFKTDVEICKTDLGETNNIPGAVLTLTGTDSSNNAVVFTADNLESTDENQATYGTDSPALTWVSGESSTMVKGLPDGTYKLTEVTPPSDYQTTTDIEFTIKNGKVENSTGNKVVMKDAEKAKLTISKADITGENEVAGAMLTITGEETSGKEISMSWTSYVDGNGDWSVKLNDGSYVLTETAVDATAAGAEYTIIPSSVSFDIVDGKVANVQSSKTVISDTAKANATDANTESYVVAKNGSTEFVVCDAKIVETKITVAKRDITGENEVKGAKLTITGTETKSGKSVDLGPWISGAETNETTDWEVTLRDGSYVLTETAVDATAAGDEYTIIPSSVSFDIVGGEVKNIKSNKTVISGTAKANATDADTESYVVAKNGSTEFVVCDAKKVEPTTTVKINKYDLTGETELPNAVLTLKNADGTDVEGVESPWTSKLNDAWVVELKDGDYVLTESQGENKIVDEQGKEYEVITSELKFTIANGEIQITDNSTSKTSGDGYYEYDETNDIIKVCDAKRVIKTNVTISKSDVTGEKELTGAKLEIRSTDENFDWSEIIEANSNTVTAVKESGDKIVGIKWESNENAPVVISGLVNGTYTLKETGEAFEFGGATYDVIESTVTFVVKDGKVTSVTSDKNDVKTSADTTSKTGYVIDKKANNTIVICDAQRTETTDVTISKTDVTGEKELTGAKLEIRSTDENFDWSEIVEANSNTVTAVREGGDKIVGIKWESNENAPVVISGLVNGTYTLKETGEAFEFGGATYDVIESTVTFVVKDGKVTSVTSDKNDVKTSADTTSKTGYVIDKKANNTIVICDAQRVVTTNVKISKTDITGQTEIEDAKLQITSTTADWTSITEANPNIETVIDDATGDVIGIKWTSTGAPVTINSLPEGTYTLRETGDKFTTGGVTYDVINSEITFTVGNDGKVTVTSATQAATNVAETEKGYAKLGEDNHIYVCDASRTDVTIAKMDITGTEEVLGAHLVVKDANDTIVEQWDSGEAAHIIRGLKNGTYTLTETGIDETKANGKFNIVDSVVTFTVKNGKVTSVVATNNALKDAPVEDAKAGYVVYNKTADANKITVCDAEQTIVEISKSDITGEPEIDGAKLTIYNEDKTEVIVSEWETDGENTKKVQLPDGTYVLRETGDVFIDRNGIEYDILTSDVKFTIINGVVTVTGAKTVADTNATESYALFDGNNKITICDATTGPKTTKVTINKFDITGNVELTGAVLTITDDQDNAVVDGWESDINKVLEVELEEGVTYTLTETQGNNKIVDQDGNEYVVIESSLTFTIEDGKVNVVSGTTTENDDGYFDVDSENNVIKVNDAMMTTKVTITKTDIAGEEELTGAVLTIKDAKGNTVAGTPWVSGKDGKTLEVELTNGTYTLTETQGEDKIVDEEGNEYTVIDSELTFTVKNGAITEVTNTTDKEDGKGFYDVDVDNNTITVSDAKKVTTTKVTINKFDITGEVELTGATLTVTDEDGNVVGGTPWESKAGEELVLDLTDGTYTLTETGDKITDEDGNEYTVIDSSLKFKVEGGKITVIEGKTEFDEEGYYDVDTAKNIIKVSDAKKAEEEDSKQPDTEDSKPDNENNDSEGTENPEDSSRTPNRDDDSRPVDDDNSTREPSRDDESRGGTTNEDDNSISGDTTSQITDAQEDSSSSSDSSKTEDSSKSSTTSSQTSTTTTTTTTATGSGTTNPNTGAKVLINSAEFLAAVGLCFVAIRRRKKDDDDVQ